MAYKVETKDDVTILIIKGNLRGGPDTVEIHDKVKELVESGNKKVILDMGGVKWMNSSGLGNMLACYTTMKNNGGDLKLARIDDKVKNVFMITQMEQIFDTYETVEGAMVGFNK